jgi:putative IMPACT (imprinted ancient) family translation regulator
MEKDTYNTLAAPGDETLFKEKGSKFFGYAFPVTDEAGVKTILADIKKQHPQARHWCYAFQLGTEPNVYYRANDDGEVRYFGGVKLGVGGLIAAYRLSAQMALEASEIVEKTIDVHYTLKFGYQDMNRVMRVIKEKNLEVVSQKMEMDCEMVVATRKKNAPMVLEAFESLYTIEVLFQV